jgi:hypothetical protein
MRKSWGFMSQRPEGKQHEGWDRMEKLDRAKGCMNELATE